MLVVFVKTVIAIGLIVCVWALLFIAYHFMMDGSKDHDIYP